MEDVQRGEFDAHAWIRRVRYWRHSRPRGQLPPTYLVGCRPAELTEGIGLTAAVQNAVPAAAAAVRRALRELINDRHSMEERVGSGMCLGIPGQVIELHRGARRANSPWSDVSGHLLQDQHRDDSRADCKTWLPVTGC